MKKNFIQWAKEKYKIDEKQSSRILCKAREIWIAKIGVNIGEESSKDSPFFRPVLIITSNILGNDLVFIAPLTSQYNENLKDFLLPVSHVKLHKQSFAQIHQVKTISKKRLQRNLDVKIPVEEMDKIKKQLQNKILKPRLNEKTHSDMKRFL